MATVSYNQKSREKVARLARVNEIFQSQSESLNSTSTASTADTRRLRDSDTTTRFPFKHTEQPVLLVNRRD